MRRLICVVSALGAVLVLSACGIRGDLERPPPLWGEDLRTEEERAHERDDDGPTQADTEGEAR